MVRLEDISSDLLRKPSDDDSHDVAERLPSSYHPLHTFSLAKDRSYQQQFADMYFLRLTQIRPSVEAAAAAAWADEDIVLGGERPTQVERVLDVRQGRLCWVAGTIYMEMPLKPSVLEDVSRDKWISAPLSTQKYFATDAGAGDANGKSGGRGVMLEDDSGRIRLVGSPLASVMLVTGCIVAVLGTENAAGDFEVIDIKFPDLPPQPERWTLSKPPARDGEPAAKKAKTGDDVQMTDAQARGYGGKIALVSGLEFSSTDAGYSTELNMLLEFLLGQALDGPGQSDVSRISRLIIAGNSIGTDTRKTADDEDGNAERKAHKKYGYDSSAYNPIPSQLLDDFLAELLPSMPVTLLPGSHDPANASYPQQPVHPAMFPRAKQFTAPPRSGAADKEGQRPGWFDPVTNPWEAEVEGWRVLGTGGQNVDDVFRYVDGDDRLAMMEHLCRWRCSAPTAPDTLWSYPFQEDDPFVMHTCPHLFFVGCQPEFGTRVIEGPEGQVVRLIALPSFSRSRELVLVDTETLEVSRVKFTTSPRLS